MLSSTQETLNMQQQAPPSQTSRVLMQKQTQEQNVLKHMILQSAQCIKTEKSRSVSPMFLNNNNNNNRGSAY